MTTHLDLFSGIGGFALAAQSNGLTTTGFSEIEPYACKVLKRHWPNVPNYGDIRNVRGIAADLVTGGFPCQPFSLAGKRGGAKDDRHLWPEMLRVIDEARPTWVLGENVPGIIGMELDNVLSDMEHIGYACWPVVVPACAVDARHRRDRVWIVCYADSHRESRLPVDAKMAGVPVVANSREGRCWRKTGREVEQQGRTKAVRPSQDVADAPSVNAWTGRPERSEERAQTSIGGEAMADAQNSIPDRRRDRLGRRCKSAVDADRCRTEGGMLWQAEPPVGRVVDGLPNRSHRLRGLGNAIVPQVAARLIAMMIEASNPSPRS